MAEQADTGHAELTAQSSNYRRPATKSLSAIIRQDAEDESLRKYKEALLGENPLGIEIFPEDPRKVIVRKLALVAEGQPEIELDLAGDLTHLREKPLVIKEGCSYRVKIYFYVQRDIVNGLKYSHQSSKNGVQVEKLVHMVGSFGPKKGLQSYTAPEEEAPSGLLARGQYHIKSSFSDDDHSEHFAWEWTIEIKKDWK